MKVLYDHQIFTLQNYGGISRYFCELMKKFNQNSDITIELALKYSNNQYIKDITFFTHRSFFETRTFKGKTSLIYFLNKRKSISSLKKQEFDIFHPTYYDPYFLHFNKKKPFVVTIHDLIYENYAVGSDPYIKYKKDLLENAAKVIAVSEYTKKDLLKFYSLEENKIKVIYHGSSLSSSNINYDNNIKLALPSVYLLFVGNRHSYKNFVFLIKSIASLLRSHKELSVICAGGGNFTKIEYELFSSLGIVDKILYKPVISNQDLWYLYHYALGLVFPSLYEGFGIPILEAFECECPVILSNTSCFPEIAGDAGIYFDPTNDSSIKQVIEMVVSDENIRTSSIKNGKNRIKNFSWEKTAEETKKVYRQVVSNA